MAQGGPAPPGGLWGGPSAEGPSSSTAAGVACTSSPLLSRKRRPLLHRRHSSRVAGTWAVQRRWRAPPNAVDLPSCGSSDNDSDPRGSRAVVPHGSGSRTVAPSCGESRASSSFDSGSRAVAPPRLPNSGDGTSEDEIPWRTGAADLSDSVDDCRWMGSCGPIHGSFVFLFLI